MQNTNSNSGLNQMKLLAKVELPNLAEWDFAQKFWADTNPASLVQISIS